MSIFKGKDSVVYVGRIILTIFLLGMIPATIFIIIIFNRGILDSYLLLINIPLKVSGEQWQSIKQNKFLNSNSGRIEISVLSNKT